MDHVDKITKDVYKGKPVVIGFCDRQDEDFVNKLSKLTGFASLINPIRYHGGEITFEREDILITANIRNLDNHLLARTYITLKEFIDFARQTVDFAVFCDGNGDALNI